MCSFKFDILYKHIVNDGTIHLLLLLKSYSGYKVIYSFISVSTVRIWKSGSKSENCLLPETSENGRKSKTVPHWREQPEVIQARMHTC